jgi:hypothetical protein
MTLIEGRKILKYVTVGGAVVLSFVHLGPASFWRHAHDLREGVSELEESRNNFIASRV